MLLLFFPSVGGGFSSPYGLATETDTALALSITLAKEYGLATETDLALEPGFQRVAALAVEVVGSWPSSARVNAMAVEVVGSYPSSARVHAMAVEVVRTISSVTSGRRRQVMPGTF